MSDKKISDRKRDHLELTERSQTLRSRESELRELFDYEPLLNGFPKVDEKLQAPSIAGKQMRAPLWIPL
jgi:hypothetical protein